MFHFIRKHTVIDKATAADCFFYLHTLFCIWIDSYFYCPIYFPHLLFLHVDKWFQLFLSNILFFLFHYNTNPSPEQVFLLFYLQDSFEHLWAFMLRSTIHLTICRGRRILVIYYVKKSSWESVAIRFTGDFWSYHIAEKAIKNVSISEILHILQMGMGIPVL